MYRFLLRPRWLAFHVACILLVALMVNLGFWQLHRLEDRQAFNRDVRERSAQEVAPFGEVVAPVVAGAAGADELTWRRVQLAGTYLADEQVLQVNRSQAGRPGVNVVTPMRLDDGTVVVVNRGFVPSATLSVDDAPAPPSGEVAVTGRVRTSERRSLGGLVEPQGELATVQRIDLPRLAEQLPGPLAPVYVELLASDPAQEGPLLPLADPELSEGPHLSYMVQWWFFSACVVVGWVLAVRRSAGAGGRRPGRDAESGGVSAAPARSSQGSPQPADDGAATAPR